MTVTGYGTTELGEDYWEIRNSYSHQWGFNGYMRLARNVEWEGGQNGILERPVFPIICSDPNGTGECKMSETVGNIYR